MKKILNHIAVTSRFIIDIVLRFSHYLSKKWDQFIYFIDDYLVLFSGIIRKKIKPLRLYIKNRLMPRISPFLKRSGHALERSLDIIPFPKKYKNFYSEYKYGILCTFIFHLLIICSFLIFKLYTSNESLKQEFVVEVVDEQMMEYIIQQMEEEDEQSGENARNIAINRAEDQIKDFGDYKVPSEQAEQILQDNIERSISEEIKNIREDLGIEDESKEQADITEQQIEEEPREIVTEKKTYKGPTNISFYLENRDATYLHIPVYKCIGSGTVHVSIRVNRKGRVILARVDASQSTAKNDCFYEAAKSAAQKTRFTFSNDEGLFQEGYIRYTFVAQ